MSWPYDYVVVGGGTSDLAIAARLAEDPGVSVAVVEAGGHHEIEGGNMSIIPGFAAAANTGTDPSDDSLLIDWNLDTPALKAANDRTIRYARGKCLGGTSARNLMVYHRYVTQQSLQSPRITLDSGTKESYAQWAEITGDSSWEWDSVLPHFKKSSTLTAPDMSKRNENASVAYNADVFDNSLNGPLQITWPNFGSPFSTYVEAGLEEIGILPRQDMNSGYLNGSAWAATTINPSDQTRSSSKTSFLNQSILKLNFKVYAHTLAKKINFSGTKAESVNVETLGIPYTLTATKEIIVSAGAFQSPQLLMVSGVGPTATLERLGINVVKDLQGVGQNLWDHALFGVVNRVNVVTASRLVNDQTAATEALVQYTFKKGPLTAPGFGVLGWEKFPQDVRSHFTNQTLEALATFPSDWPEVEYIGLDGILDGWHSSDDRDLGDGHEYGTIAAALVAPLSRGTVSTKAPTSSPPPSSTSPNSPTQQTRKLPSQPSSAPAKPSTQPASQSATNTAPARTCKQTRSSSSSSAPLSSLSGTLRVRVQWANPQTLELSSTSMPGSLVSRTCVSSMRASSPRSRQVTRRIHVTWLRKRLRPTSKIEIKSNIYAYTLFSRFPLHHLTEPRLDS